MGPCSRARKQSLDWWSTNTRGVNMEMVLSCVSYTQLGGKPGNWTTFGFVCGQQLRNPRHTGFWRQWRIVWIEWVMHSTVTSHERHVTTEPSKDLVINQSFLREWHNCGRFMVHYSVVLTHFFNPILKWMSQIATFMGPNPVGPRWAPFGPMNLGIRVATILRSCLTVCMACNGFAIVSTSIQTLTPVHIRLGQFPHLGNYTLTYWFIVNMCGSGDMCVCVRECKIAVFRLQWSRGGMVSMPIISLYRVNYSRLLDPPLLKISWKPFHAFFRNVARRPAHKHTNQQRWKHNLCWSVKINIQCSWLGHSCKLDPSLISQRPPIDYIWWYIWCMCMLYIFVDDLAQDFYDSCWRLQSTMVGLHGTKWYRRFCS